MEEIARTGRDALRFGALKPVGLTDPRTGHRPWAAVQLRAENREGTAYNLVGFQTNLTWPEQRRVFRLIPGLEQAGVLPLRRHAQEHLRGCAARARPHVRHSREGVRLAGQICGTEGYVEAIASGLLAALQTHAELAGMPPVALPRTGALGSLVAYATDPRHRGLSAMHVNFGLVPQPLSDGRRRSKRDRYARTASAPLADLDAYIASRPDIWGAAGLG